MQTAIVLCHSRPQASQQSMHFVAAGLGDMGHSLRRRGCVAVRLANGRLRNRPSQQKAQRLDLPVLGRMGRDIVPGLATPLPMGRASAPDAPMRSELLSSASINVGGLISEQVAIEAWLPFRSACACLPRRATVVRHHHVLVGLDGQRPTRVIRTDHDVAV